MEIGHIRRGFTCRVYKPKMLTAAIIGAGVAVASTAVGTAVSAAANRRALAMSAAEKEQELNQIRAEKNTKYIDTEQGRDLVRRMNESVDRQTKKVAARQAYSGGTLAQSAEAKEAANRTVGNTMSQIAANDTARKDRLSAEERQVNRQFSQQAQQYELARGQNVAMAAQNLGNAAMTFASGVSGGGSTKKSVAG